MALGLILLAGAAVHSVACSPITSDQITGRDLALAVPALASLPPEKVISPAPLAGQRRIFWPAELFRIAKASNIDASFSEAVCFEWPQSPLDRSRVESAMQASLSKFNARLELIDLSPAPVPDGALSFSLDGLATADGPVVWRGFLQYAKDRKLSVWARVRVTVEMPQIVAVENLLPNQPVRASEVRTEMYRGPFRKQAYFNDPQQAIGAIPLTTVNAGTILHASLLREANDVERGDTILVSVRIGQTHVESQGIAEEGGSRGTSILVRNIKTGRKFRALIEDRGRVLVLPTGLAGLVVEDPKSS